jgi:hypothetical protein
VLIAALEPFLQVWMPTCLAAGMAALIGQPAPASLWHSILIAALASPALVGLAVTRLGQREP